VDNEKLQILALTIANEDAASSRLRSYYLFRCIEKYDVAITRDFNCGNIIQSNILHVQKVIKIKYLLCAMLFRLLGRKVVFDIDDQPSGFRLGRYYIGRLLIWSAFAFMMMISSHVTTDTPERRKYWDRFGFKNIFVIPDAIDIDPELSFPSIEGFQGQWESKLLWVGHAANLNSIIDLVDLMGTNTRMKMVLITNVGAINKIKHGWPWVESITWQKDITLSEEFRLSAMILNHGLDQDSKLKSENKMVLAIASGIIPIVSRTPAYSRLAKAIHAERLLYDDVKDVPAILSALTKDWVDDFFERARKYIQDTYSSEHLFFFFRQMIVEG